MVPEKVTDLLAPVSAHGVFFYNLKAEVRWL